MTIESEYYRDWSMEDLEKLYKAFRVIRELTGTFDIIDDDMMYELASTITGIKEGDYK